MSDLGSGDNNNEEDVDNEEDIGEAEDLEGGGVEGDDGSCDQDYEIDDDGDEDDGDDDNNVSVMSDLSGLSELDGEGPEQVEDIFACDAHLLAYGAVIEKKHKTLIPMSMIPQAVKNSNSNVNNNSNNSSSNNKSNNNNSRKERQAEKRSQQRKGRSKDNYDVNNNGIVDGYREDKGRGGKDKNTAQGRGTGKRGGDEQAVVAGQQPQMAPSKILSSKTMDKSANTATAVADDKDKEKVVLSLDEIPFVRDIRLINIALKSQVDTEQRQPTSSAPGFLSSEAMKLLDDRVNLNILNNPNTKERPRIREKVGGGNKVKDMLKAVNANANSASNNANNNISSNVAPIAPATVAIKVRERSERKELFDATPADAVKPRQRAEKTVGKERGTDNEIADRSSSKKSNSNGGSKSRKGGEERQGSKNQSQQATGVSKGRGKRGGGQRSDMAGEMFVDENGMVYMSGPYMVGGGGISGPGSSRRGGGGGGGSHQQMQMGFNPNVFAFDSGNKFNVETRNSNNSNNVSSSSNPNMSSDYFSGVTTLRVEAKEFVPSFLSKS